MKRFAGLFVVAAWLAAVIWYWRENVPLVPTKTVDLPPDRTVAMISPTGELVVSSYQSQGRLPKRTGPFEFWSFPEVKKVREELGPTDEVVSDPNYRTGDILIRRDGTLLLYNLYSGRVLTTLPDLAEVRGVRVIPGREQLLVQSDRGLHLFAYNNPQPLWTAKDLRLGFESKVAGEILIAKVPLSSGPGSRRVLQATAVSVSTGKVDHRFDQPERVRRVELSSDGRRALVFPERSGPRLCDAATGNVLWTVPADPTVDWWMADSGDAIYGHATGDDETIRRLRASDGAWMKPLVDQEIRIQQRLVTGDGRFAHLLADAPPPRIVQQWINQSTYLSNSWRNRLFSTLHRHRSKVIDHQTGSLVGYFPDYVRPFVLNDNLGFATFTPGRIAYYALPPQRNWWWLARWALVPPTILVLLSRTWRRLRRKRIPAEATPPELPRFPIPNPSGIPPAACVILDRCSEG